MLSKKRIGIYGTDDKAHGIFIKNSTKSNTNDVVTGVFRNTVLLTEHVGLSKQTVQG